MNKTEPRNDLLSSPVDITSQTNKVSLHQSAFSIGILNLCTLNCLSVRYGSTDIYGAPRGPGHILQQASLQYKGRTCSGDAFGRWNQALVLWPWFISFIYSLYSSKKNPWQLCRAQETRFLCFIPYRGFASPLSYSHHHDHSLIF